MRTGLPCLRPAEGRHSGIAQPGARDALVTLIDTLTKTPAELRHPEKQNRPETVVLKKPDWLRVKAPGSGQYNATKAIVKDKGLVTVCEEAACPNIGECWSQKHATLMIMGDTCTRACAFCNVKTGLPQPLDPEEPAKVGLAVAQLGLNHVVITSVDRDDISDGGAAHFAEVVRQIRLQAPDTTIEILTPDFLRKDGAAEVMIDATPDVFNHNLETVPRLYLKIRPGGDPRRGHAGYGRHALCRRRLHHHRPVPAAHPQTRRHRPVRHAGRVQGL